MSVGYKGLGNTPTPDINGIVAFLISVRTMLNNLLIGKQNVTLDITLNAGAATTTIQDPRIGGTSGFYFSPTSANAQAIATPWPSSPGAGSVVLNHANDANADKTFRMLIIG